MIFNEIKNDVAFIIDDRFIILTEHQSTLSPNFPLRMLCYLGKEYEKTSFSKDIFRMRLKKIPTPNLFNYSQSIPSHPTQASLDKTFAYSSLVCCNYGKGRIIFKLQEREIIGG